MMAIAWHNSRVSPQRAGWMCGTVLLLGGCASTAVFVPYPSQIAPIKQQIESGQYQAAQEKLNKYRNSADKILYLLERGRTAQVARDYPTSTADFAAAIDAIEANERKARITASGSFATGASILVNDNAIPYAEKPFERVFLHHYQALNYLFSGNVEAAAVEVRRANEQQELALDAHDAELAALEKRHRTELASNPNFMESYATMRAAAGRVKNSFQNAYTFYASGVIWELDDKPNDAYIDYKKALEIFPDNPFVQRDVLRLARALSMNEDLERFSKQFKVEEPAADPRGGELIVFFDSGYVPTKQEIKIPIAIRDGLYAVAFPIYRDEWRRTPLLSVSLADSRALGTASPIVNVQALAAKALQEELPGMLVRQVLRVAAKRNTTKQAGQTFGYFGAFASNVLNFLTENADLRGWLTLPNEAQVFRTPLQPGKHTLLLRSGSASDRVTVDIDKQRKTLLHVVYTGRAIRVSSIVL